MELGELKPLLKLLVLPPGPFIVLPLVGLLAGLRWRRFGGLLIFLSCLTFWLLSTGAVSAFLGRTLLPAYPTLVVQDLKDRKVEAIVIVGGGLSLNHPEYGGEAQLGQYTIPRARYAVWLARQSRLPLGYTGGIAWGSRPGAPTEGDVARRTLQQDYGMPLRWVENQSRDTAENGRLMGEMLRRDGIKRVALVTHQFHMARVMRAFADSGLEIVPAPLGRFHNEEATLIDWLPSLAGLNGSYLVLYEWLGLQVAKLRP